MSWMDSAINEAKQVIRNCRHPLPFQVVKPHEPAQTSRERFREDEYYYMGKGFQNGEMRPVRVLLQTWCKQCGSFVQEKRLQP